MDPEVFLIFLAVGKKVTDILLLLTYRLIWLISVVYDKTH